MEKMYKLILADDEEEVIEGILNKTDWSACGFETPGIAQNGRDALDIMEKSVPDVLITDIIMPYMDGLELCQCVKKRFPTVKIIILTGYDEFEYARKAIELNVIEYVLKPVPPDEFTNLLLKVKSGLDDEIAGKKDLQALRELYEKSLPLLRERFLASLVMGGAKAGFAEKANNLGLDLGGDMYLVSLLDIDACSQCPAGGDAAARGFNLPDDGELLNYAVLNITGEILEKRRGNFVFLNGSRCVILSAHAGRDRDAFMYVTLEIMEEIRLNIEKYLGMTVTIGIGNIIGNLAEAGVSCRNAEAALDYRLLLGGNRVICIDDVEPLNRRANVLDELKEHSLTRCIRLGAEGELKSLIDGLFGEIRDRRSSFKDYQILYLELLTIILRSAESMNVDTGSLIGESRNLFLKISGFGSMEEAKAWLLALCSRIMGDITVERQDSCRLLVEKAKDYIKSNYTDAKITIDTMCKFLHISPAYFSSIFKRETHMTFVNYLQHIRMEEAKELLRTTGLKAFEIAERLGFSEPNYFSYCFKKSFGISPTEYRNGADQEVSGRMTHPANPGNGY